MDERERFEDLPILGDLRDLLSARMREADGVAPAIAGPRRRVGWLVAGLRRAPIALAVAVAIAVVAVGLVALHHRGPAHHTPGPAGHGSPNPTAPLPSPPASPAQGYVNRAQREVTARDHACVPATNRGQTINHGSPGQRVLSQFGVLRRPPLAPDPTNRVLYGIGWDKGAGVYVNYIRRARTEYGRSYWIFLEARMTPFSPIPARCYSEFHAQLQHDLRHATPALRAQALKAQRQTLAGTRAETTPREALCFVEIGLHVRPHPGAVGYGCSPVPTSSDPFEGGNVSGAGGGGTIRSGVVPDGIVAVTMRFAASGRDRARTVTSNVVNNVYVLKIPPHTASFPSKTVLTMSGGGERTISVAPPPAQAVAGPPAQAVAGGAGGGG